MIDKPTETPLLDESAIAEQAARWHAVLKSAGPRELEELAAWLKMSPRHGYHFLCTTTVDRLLSRIDPDRTKFDPHAWVREARETVVPLHATRTASARPLFTPGKNRSPLFLSSVAVSAAALLLVALGGWWWAVHSWGWKDFSTRPVEQQSIELQEGSIIHLNTESHVRVRLTQAVRDIHLTRGEALFKVHHDPQRPFRVHAPGSIIQAVGTAFTVDIRNSLIEVAVIDGAVRVTPDKTGAQPSMITAGQQVEITTAGEIRHRPAREASAVVGSLQRRLVFHADALADMAAEFNRYNLAPKFRLDGIDGYARHYTGTFDADDPDSFATVLSEEKVYSVERTAEEIIIRRSASVTPSSIERGT